MTATVIEVLYQGGHVDIYLKSDSTTGGPVLVRRPGMGGRGIRQGDQCGIKFDPSGLSVFARGGWLSMASVTARMDKRTGGAGQGALSPLPGVAEARRDIAAGRLTSEQLVGMCLDAIAKHEGDVCAWTHYDADAAMEEARRKDQQTDRRGPLHGIPFGVKDIIDVAGWPTGFGSRIYDGHVSRRDAACVALLKHAGAICLGKTVSTELGHVAPGKTRNPHDLRRTPGGSSSGSAAAVAAGMASFAIGTQTTGSVLRPAAFCGVVG